MQLKKQITRTEGAILQHDRSSPSHAPELDNINNSLNQAALRKVLLRLFLSNHMSQSVIRLIIGTLFLTGPCTSPEMPLNQFIRAARFFQESGQSVGSVKR